MKKSNVLRNPEFFKVLDSAAKTQTAVMTLSPGQESGETGNEHAGSDQVLYVVKGEVCATIAGETQTLHEGDAVIVPAGAEHQFVNKGSTPALTFNVYAPPAY